MSTSAGLCDVDLETATVELCASIGVACSEPGLDGATLTKQADLAMYEAKQRGDGQPVLYGGSAARDR